MSAVSEVLHESADIIERQGWTKGNGMTPGEGPKCLMGAIGQAIGAPVMDMRPIFDRSCFSYAAVERHPAHIAVAEHIDDAIASAWGMFHWNDAEDRTAEDVIGVLRAAAVIEEARESQRTPVSVG